MKTKTILPNFVEIDFEDVEEFEEWLGAIEEQHDEKQKEVCQKDSKKDSEKPPS